MENIHGGDIYRNHVKIDFSVNVNPLGIPKRVEKALHEAVSMCTTYPDTEAEKLKKAVAEMLHISEDFLLFGNGASELFMAIVHALHPKRTVIPIPSFYGYEHAAGSAESEIIFCDDFTELPEETDLLFLANPNNPTGALLDKMHLTELLNYCKEREIIIVLDECFVDFCGSEFSMISEIQKYPNLIIVRAFTKIFAIPGVRLGYLISENRELLGKIRRQLPEWNLSCFAQTAGCVCASESAFIAKTIAYINRERKFLEDGLCKAGFQVFPSKTNFILLYSEIPLYDKLLEHGILIRDCSNFRGLKQGYYRVAIKTREENEKLLKAIGEID